MNIIEAISHVKTEKQGDEKAKTRVCRVDDFDRLRYLDFDCCRNVYVEYRSDNQSDMFGLTVQDLISDRWVNRDAT